MGVGGGVVLHCTAFGHVVVTTDTGRGKCQYRAYRTKLSHKLLAEMFSLAVAPLLKIYTGAFCLAI